MKYQFCYDCNAVTEHFFKPVMVGNPKLGYVPVCKCCEQQRQDERILREYQNQKGCQ
jgi:hypothetical protein